MATTGRLAVTGEIHGDGPDAGPGERGEVCPPHPAVDGPGVQEDERPAPAGFVERKYHGRSALSGTVGGTGAVR
ncbi:hypothetical protein GCM10018782_02170 [Streptomyces griseoaurantiacus]|nr:hypothetical protein GCM10018782_02170 [Streptomyces griseoaurantiacus]